MTEFGPFDYQCMARALQLAERGRYSCDPNPRVGCVIARGGAIVGEGFHRRAGEAHAEVEALRQAGEAARGATAYVTLEPCNHQGRTGPCSRALIRAGIAEVVYGTADPHPRAGGGLATLRAAGVRVRGPLLERQCRALNAGFFRRLEGGRPLVVAKVAASLDGRTAMASGEARWITGEAARRDVQRLRAESSAVLTGIGTVLADDPHLGVRAADLPLPPSEAAWAARRQPLRVVVDSRARTPATARLFAAPGLVAVATAGPAGPWPPGTLHLPLPDAEGRVDLVALLAALAERECNQVLVEAGPRLLGALLRAGLVDRLVVYLAPKLLGSSASPLAEFSVARLAEALELAVEEIRPVGRDLRLTARVEAA